MTAHEFRAMGTTWAVYTDASRAALREAEAFVRDAEARLSRFRPDSALTRLNRERASRDPVLASVIVAALPLSRATKGAFDPSLGRQVAAIGYDRTFDDVGGIPTSVVEPTEPLLIEVDDDDVRLHGGGEVDLGGIAKGWTVDRVVELLAARGATTSLVDGGGDIRVTGGAWPIGVGDGLHVDLVDGAIATSSTQRRRWRDARGRSHHHIVDPRTGRSARSTVETVTVTAADAATADALATALIVDPGLSRTLDRFGAQAALCVAGQWWTTPGWKERP